MSVVGFELFMGVIFVIFYKVCVSAVTSCEPCNCYCNICMRLSMMMLKLQSMLLHINRLVQMTLCDRVIHS